MSYHSRPLPFVKGLKRLFVSQTKEPFTERRDPKAAASCPEAHKLNPWAYRSADGFFRFQHIEVV
jgi:hypothetical protein